MTIGQWDRVKIVSNAAFNVGNTLLGLYANDAQIQAGRASVDATKQLNEFLISLRENPDYENYLTSFKQESQNIRERIIRGLPNRAAQEAFLQDYYGMEAAVQNKVVQQSMNMRQETLYGELISGLNEAVNNPGGYELQAGNIDKLINRAFNLNIIDAPRAKELREKYLAQLSANATRTGAFNVYDQAGYDEAILYVQENPFNTDEENTGRILSALNARHNEELKQRQEQIKQAVRDAETNFVEALAKGSFSLDLVESYKPLWNLGTPETVNAYEKWVKLALKESGEGEGGSGEYDILPDSLRFNYLSKYHNPMIDNDYLKRWLNGEIAEMVPSLSTEDAKALSEWFTKEVPNIGRRATSPALNRGAELIEGLFKKRIDEAKKKNDTSTAGGLTQELNSLLERFYAYVAETPNLSEADIVKIAEQLATPVAIKPVTQQALGNRFLDNLFQTNNETLRIDLYSGKYKVHLENPEVITRLTQLGEMDRMDLVRDFGLPENALTVTHSGKDGTPAVVYTDAQGVEIYYRKIPDGKSTKWQIYKHPLWVDIQPPKKERQGFSFTGQQIQNVPARGAGFIQGGRSRQINQNTGGVTGEF